jgi:hypothetical protein
VQVVGNCQASVFFPGGGASEYLLPAGRGNEIRWFGSDAGNAVKNVKKSFDRTIYNYFDWTIFVNHPG